MDNQELYLRDAVWEDLGILFQWANDPEVRKNSFSTGEISIEEHRAWYANLLENQDMRQYILVHKGTDIGQIRIYIYGNQAEIGYSIASKYRCMGYGKHMLYLLAEKVKKDFPHIEKLTAKVKPENIASKKVFIDLGYMEKCSVYEFDLGSEKGWGGVISNQKKSCS